jgi:ketosteroid isomerase-like protein
MSIPVQRIIAPVSVRTAGAALRRRFSHVLVAMSVGSAVLSLTVACGKTAASRADSEQAIRAADSAWATAFNAKRLDESVAVVSSTGSVLAPNAPIATGTNAVRELFKGFMALPDLKITWQPTEVHAAESGELGYSVGTYEMSFKDPTGKTVVDQGKYGTVWQKQSDGRWKVVLDVFNSNLPVPGTKP